MDIGKKKKISWHSFFKPGNEIGTNWLPGKLDISMVSLESRTPEMSKVNYWIILGYACGLTLTNNDNWKSTSQT